MKPVVDDVITKLGLNGVDEIVPLKELCKKLKISRPAYLVFAVSIVSAAMILIGLAERVLTNVIGILYPTWMSIKAIETRADSILVLII